MVDLHSSREVESAQEPRSATERVESCRVRMNIPSSAPGVLSRSRAVGLSLLQVPLAASSPAGFRDRCAADPTHPSAWYTCYCIDGPEHNMYE